MYFSGKWHVSVEDSPADRGWQEHFVSAAAGTLHGTKWENYRKLAEQPDDTERGEGEILRPGYGTYRLYGTDPGNRNRHDETTMEQALNILNSLKDEDDPWCLYVGAIAPHDPYMVPQKYLDLYDLDDIPLPPNYTDELVDKPTCNAYFSFLSFHDIIFYRVIRHTVH